MQHVHVPAPQEYHGARADCWSLGVILFRMVAGELPFRARTLNALRTAMLEGDAAWPPGLHVSRRLQALVGGLLHKDPAARTTAEEVTHHAWLTAGRGSLTALKLGLGDLLADGEEGGGGEDTLVAAAKSAQPSPCSTPPASPVALLRLPAVTAGGSCTSTPRAALPAAAAMPLPQEPEVPRLSLREVRRPRSISTSLVANTAQREASTLPLSPAVAPLTSKRVVRRRRSRARSGSTPASPALHSAPSPVE